MHGCLDMSQESSVVILCCKVYGCSSNIIQSLQYPICKSPPLLGTNIYILRGQEKVTNIQKLWKGHSQLLFYFFLPRIKTSFEEDTMNRMVHGVEKPSSHTGCGENVRMCTQYGAQGHVKIKIP